MQHSRLHCHFSNRSQCSENKTQQIEESGDEINLLLIQNSKKKCHLEHWIKIRRTIVIKDPEKKLVNKGSSLFNTAWRWY